MLRPFILFYNVVYRSCVKLGILVLFKGLISSHSLVQENIPKNSCRK